jgi:hypothetical protein
MGGAFGGGPGGGGIMTQSITYRNVGTSVEATPHLNADGTVLLELMVEDSQVLPAETGADVGNEPRRLAVPAPEFVTSTFESRLKVRPGHVIQAEDTKTVSKAGQAQKVILVTASVEEPAPEGGKQAP